MTKNKMPQWYERDRDTVYNNLTPENYRGIVEKSTSPDKEYIFIVEKYVANNQTLHRGTIYHKKGKQILSIGSSACNFWHYWIDNYLICNEVYFGYTIIKPDEEFNFTYVDPKGHSGWGFSWDKVIPSPDGKHLVVQGNRMGINEFVLYEFDPKNLPLKKLKCLNVPFRTTSLKGWHNNKLIIENENRATMEIGM